MASVFVVPNLAIIGTYMYLPIYVYLPLFPYTFLCIFLGKNSHLFVKKFMCKNMGFYGKKWH